MAALASAFAPGKLILSGEHAVVYGHPALAMAVDRGCRVTLRRRSGPSGVDRAPVSDARLQQAVAQLLPAEGIGVEIDSDLPIGKGMGSSAAMSIGLVQALAQLNGEILGFDRLHESGFVLERVFHGTPSGIDHAVSALGGLLYYRQTEEGPEMRQVEAELPRLVVVDSGVRGDTAQQVARVRAMGERGTRICGEIGDLTRRLMSLLPGPAHAEMGALMTENHQHLVRLGVSNPQLDALVQLALDSGAYGAKLAGAGGGGVVIAAVQDPKALLDAATREGFNAFSTELHPVRMDLQ
jgi:mevalonate kinase